MITIKPFGGLANRMRALDSGYWLAKRSKRPLHIIWENNFELNCSFQKLFQIPDGITLEEHNVNRVELFFKKRINNAWRLLGGNIPRGYDFYLFDKEVVALEQQKFDFEEILEYKSIFINTVEHFYETETMFKQFKPAKELQKVIKGYKDLFSNNTIGIHIRRTDNANAIKYSPLSGFLNFMENEIEKDPKTKFFLATDSPQVNKAVYDKYGKHIISHDKDLNRNTEKGIKDALIDIYCLSNCKKILGSYHSSFSHVASQLGKIKLDTIYKE